MLNKKNLKIILLTLIIILVIAVIILVTVNNKNKDKKSEKKEETVNLIIKEENEIKVDLSTLDVEEKDEIGKEKIEEFLEIYKNNSPKGILVTLGLLEMNHNFEPEDYVDRFFAKTNIQYDDFKNIMLNYMTEQLFNSYYENQGFKEVDGFLCFSDIGEEEKEYEVTELKLIENKDTEMIYEITFKETETNNIEKAKITVIEKDNDYVIDKYEKI